VVNVGNDGEITNVFHQLKRLCERLPRSALEKNISLIRPTNA